MTESGLLIAPELAALHTRYAVYRCYSDAGQLLYIGSTGGANRRFLDHSQKAWFLEVRGVTFEWYTDELDARNAERRAIHVEHPKYNVQHRNTKLRNAPRRTAKRTPRPKVSGADTVADARKILAEEPGISGSQLGRRLGKSDSYGRLLMREFLSTATLG